jgi:hypothetical protein
MVKADGLLIIPSETAEIGIGQTVKGQLLGKNLLAQSVPGY